MDDAAPFFPHTGEVTCQVKHAHAEAPAHRAVVELPNLPQSPPSMFDRLTAFEV